MTRSHVLLPRRLSAQLLGTYAVSLDGRSPDPRAWRHGSAERLLKLLLVSPRHQLRREVAAELLWPDAPPGRAMANLRRAQHFLARAFETGTPGALLLHDARVVGFCSEVQLETDHQALESALDRLHGLLRARGPRSDDDWLRNVSSETEQILRFGSCELLPDDPYEDWLARPRDQLMLHRQSVMLSAAQALADGNYLAQAHAVVDRSLEMDPADEDAHRLAIELYAREGRGHAARRQFLACQRILRDQFAADPSPLTVAALVSGSARTGPEPELVQRPLEAGAIPAS